MVQWRRARLLGVGISILMVLGRRGLGVSVPGEAQRSGCERVLQVVSDLGWVECQLPGFILSCDCSNSIYAGILILGSFLFLLSRAWLAGVEEKSARCCCCWARQPRTVARGASERHRGEKVRKSAVDGAFIVVVVCGDLFIAGCIF